MKKESKNAFSFLDVETTGLSPLENDRVCEIAVLRLNEDGSIQKWQSLVNPERPISPGASAVSGITDAMVANAPRFSEVASTVLRMIEGTILVCHNASFDVSFLYAELKHCGMRLPELPVIDTLRLARCYFDFPSNRLGNIADYLGITATERHRALADVDTTQKIFAYFLKELTARGIAIPQLVSDRFFFPGRNM
jgi:DNA polymerase-3 subunit epsilon